MTKAAFGLTACQKPVSEDLQTWEFTALGAPAFIKLATVDAPAAKRAFADAHREINRLERIFSLYLADSEISQLNANGALENASPEMLEVLQAAHTISKLSRGAFDISVQPLWVVATQIQHNSFTQDEIDARWQAARAHVDYREIHIKGQNVAFGKPNMGITLNAIAQGYITDKISALLSAKGYKNGLVNIGEYRGFGTKNGTPWTVGIQDPINILNTLDVFELNDLSLATSSALGGQIGENLYHIFDAHRSVPINQSPRFVSASVLHPTAMIADALATAFTIMNLDEIRTCAQHVGNVQGVLVQADGEIIRI